MYVMGLAKGLDAVKIAVSEGVLPNRSVGFIPTAGATYDNPYFVDESRKRLQAAGLHTVDVDVERIPTAESIRILDSVDGIFVAGGNSFHLLKVWKEKKLDGVIRQKILSGVPYFGESAGAVVLFGSIEPAGPIDDPQDVPGFTDYQALDVVDFFVLPHVDREKYKPLFEKFMADNAGMKIVRIRDDQAVLTRDGTSFEVIDSPIVDLG